MQRQWVIQLTGILIVILLLSYAIPRTHDIIPNYIAKHVQQHLENNGLTWAKVAVKERSVVISGTSPTVQEHQQAIHISRSLWTVKHVTDAIQPRIIEPYTMHIHWDGSLLSLTGFVQNEANKVRLEQQIASEYSNSTIKNDLQIGAGAPDNWNPAAKQLLHTIRPLALASVHLIDQTVTIAGKTSTTQEMQAVQQATEPLQQLGYQFKPSVIALDNAAVVCQKEFNRLLSQEKIRFTSGGSTIDNSSSTLLGALADAAIFCANSNIIITGHTDNIGSDKNNLKLSEQRAKAVKGWLFNEGGVPLERLKTQGKGASEALETNETKEGRAKNRRIEFIVEGI